MHVIFISACQKRAIPRSRAILDSYALRRGTLLDVAHDDRRVAGSARRFSPKRYTTDFRGLLPERWAPPYGVTLDSGRTGTFRA